MTDSRLVSVVVPIFNEREIVPELHRRLTAALAGQNYEVVYVDDRSTDGSLEELTRFADRDARVRVLRFSRNFGHQIAISAGIDAARGDAVVVMDGDLQDPPEAIPELLAQWERGYDVVYGVRVHREGETAFKRLTAILFYKLLRRLTQVDIPEQAGDFRLYSRRAAEALREMPERARFIRGMSSWIGFRQIGVPYRRDPRYAGDTKYPLRKMVRFSLDAIMSFSTAPLRLMSMLGFGVVVLCCAYLAYVLYAKLFTTRTVHGFTSVVVLVALLGGIQLLCLGVVGQYIARIFEEAKRRPLYILDDSVVGHQNSRELRTEHAALEDRPLGSDPVVTGGGRAGAEDVQV
jgi:glycosyltransferase involved in cell wall biosynthesis